MDALIIVAEFLCVLMCFSFCFYFLLHFSVICFFNLFFSFQVYFLFTAGLSSIWCEPGKVIGNVVVLFRRSLATPSMNGYYSSC